MAEKNALAQFGDAIKEALEKKAAEEKAKQATMPVEEETDDLNILPIPACQNIRDGWIEWVWDVNQIRVMGVLYTQPGNDGKEPGYYEVNILSETANEFKSFDPDTALDLGKALISAQNWRHVWKQHAGHFLEKQLMVPQKPEPKKVNVSKEVAAEHDAGAHVHVDMGKPYPNDVVEGATPSVYEPLMPRVEIADGKEIPRDRD